MVWPAPADTEAKAVPEVPPELPTVTADAAVPPSRLFVTATMSAPHRDRGTIVQVEVHVCTGRGCCDEPGPSTSEVQGMSVAGSGALVALVARERVAQEVTESDTAAWVGVTATVGEELAAHAEVVGERELR